MLDLTPAKTPSQPDAGASPAAGCASCPYRYRLPAADLSADPGSDELVDLVESGTPPQSMEMAKARKGIDLISGPHRVVEPGWADFAQIEDPADRAFALVMNDEAPVCACARKLMESASHETTPYSLAVKMRLLETSLPAQNDALHHRPSQQLRRRVKQAKLPRGRQDVWSAFGINV